MQERDPTVVRVLLQDQASARVREPVLVQELVEVQMDPAVVWLQVSGWGLEPGSVPVRELVEVQMDPAVVQVTGWELERGSVRLAVRVPAPVQEPGLVLVPGQGWWSRR